VASVSKTDEVTALASLSQTVESTLGSGDDSFPQYSGLFKRNGWAGDGGADSVISVRDRISL
jgi:hypothetical protein